MVLWDDKAWNVLCIVVVVSVVIGMNTIILTKKYKYENIKSEQNHASAAHKDSQQRAGQCT